MNDNKSQDKNLGDNQALAQLERQVERGSLFTHTIVSQNADQIHEAEAFLYGAIDLLICKGIFAPDEILKSASRIRQEMDEKGQTIGPGIALRIEKGDQKEDDCVLLNCSERLHICKAACCRLHFALTAEEVENGSIKWDLGSPYYIRQEFTGYCHHLNMNTKGCSRYNNRPGVCRRYSCVHDERIWKNFKEMQLNEEWIHENLTENRLRLENAFMMLI